MVSFLSSSSLWLAHQHQDVVQNVPSCSNPDASSFTFATGRRTHDGRFRLSEHTLYSLLRNGPDDKQVAPKHAFASLTASLWDTLRNTGLRRTYSLIDKDNKGYLSLSDLEVFARANGLPTGYCSHFISAVLGSTPAIQLDDGHEQAEVSFQAFSRFVRSREAALRRAFSLFDKDKDGRISVEDLETSLAHVAVCCPKTRCVYRCHKRMAHDLISKIHGGPAYSCGADATPCSSGTEASSSDSAASTTSTTPSSSKTVDFSQFRSFFMLLPQTDMMVEYWLSSGRCPDLDTKVMIHTPEDAGKQSPWGHLFAGAVAGAASRTATAPLETLRLAVMTGSLQTTNLVQAAADIVEQQGWRGLYRGNALNVLRSAPQKALDFFAFDRFKRLLGADDYVMTFVAAGLAGATSWVTLYPLEVVRSRVTSGHAPAKDVTTVMRMIVAAEGVGALYKGLGWSLAAIFPEAAITYGLHDLLKRCYRTVNQGQEPTVLASLSFGVLSAFTGQLVAFPLETVSRRLQVYQGTDGLSGVLKTLLQQGGPLALYRGVGAATLRLIPMAIVSFGTYELVRSTVVAVEDWAEEQQANQEYQQLHSFCTPLGLTSGSSQAGSAGSSQAGSTGSSQAGSAGSIGGSTVCSLEAAAGSSTSTASSGGVASSSCTLSDASSCKGEV